jgi:hypothetical protein
VLRIVLSDEFTHTHAGIMWEHSTTDNEKIKREFLNIFSTTTIRATWVRRSFELSRNQRSIKKFISLFLSEALRQFVHECECADGKEGKKVEVPECAALRLEPSLFTDPWVNICKIH